MGSALMGSALMGSEKQKALLFGKRRKNFFEVVGVSGGA
jgi:hypothetical protein